jgi:hypothetical protein
MKRALLAIIAAMMIFALPLTTSAARSPKRETGCQEVCAQARASTVLNAQQKRLLRTCVAARICTPPANSPRDVESKPNAKTLEPYPCKFFMC